MGKKVKFTFKKGERLRGFEAYGASIPDTELRLGGVVVGNLRCGSGRIGSWKWRIYFHGMSRNMDSGWVWRRIVQEFDTEKDAREWVKLNAVSLFSLLCDKHRNDFLGQEV